MSHFRWNKFGRRNSSSGGGGGGGHKREEELGGNPPQASLPEEEEEEEEGQEEEKRAGGSYRMRHFRWHGPLKDKRYGGFMTSEHSQTPLVTLFKNAIIKSAYKKGQ
uniref:Opiodes neuropeptide domain-containing protein n=1 Tax=Calidris pygmaea TaxID=425635 RepID=A0A8C3KHE5_9CHAR